MDSNSQSTLSPSLATGESVSPGVRSGGQGWGGAPLEVAQYKGGAEGVEDEMFTHL